MTMIDNVLPREVEPVKNSTYRIFNKSVRKCDLNPQNTENTERYNYVGTILKNGPTWPIYELNLHACILHLCAKFRIKFLP